MNNPGYNHEIADPRHRFESPWDVVEAPSLSRYDKLKVLEDWESDARLRQVADEENMNGPDVPGDELKQVRNALRDLSGTGAVGTGRDASARMHGADEVPPQTVRGVINPEPCLVHADHSVHEAAKMLRATGQDVVFVVDGDEVIGTVLHRDIVHEVIARERDAKELTLRQIMTSSITWCRVGEDLGATAANLAMQSDCSLGVVDRDGSFVGAVSLPSIVAGIGWPAVHDVVVRSLAAMPSTDTPAPSVTKTRGRATLAESGGLHVYAEKTILRS